MEGGWTREEQCLDCDLCLRHGQGQRQQTHRAAGVESEELASGAGDVADQ